MAGKKALVIERYSCCVTNDSLSPTVVPDKPDLTKETRLALAAA
jgi:hypothetical protein